MRRWRIRAECSTDDYNMGYITLQRYEKFARSRIVKDSQGRTLFVLDLDTSGRLMGIECYDAATQMTPPAKKGRRRP